MKILMLIVLFVVAKICCQLSLDNNIFISKMQDGLPVPHEIPNLLFYLQRDPDSNTVCYTLDLDRDGKLNSSSPIRIFWVQYAKKGEHKELNYLQKKLAYGVKVHRLGKDNYEIISQSYPKRPLYLRKDHQNNFHVYTTINYKDCILKRVFIRISGGTPLSPHIEYIEWTGTELDGGKVITEKINIS